MWPLERCGGQAVGWRAASALWNLTMRSIRHGNQRRQLRGMAYLDHQTVSCGHFMAEEAPAEVPRALRALLAR
ncbi:hypothetical protein [Micromonospora sp. NPDC005220]|uniref:hypothetical protein n=1 Tax=Micromonospora sp. NPDC005220 TaxID=3155589 RepID=UPI0033BEB9DF